MLLASLDRRLATAIRLLGLALVASSILSASSHAPGTSGRDLVVTLLTAAAVVSWLAWTIYPDRSGVTADLYVMAGAGGLLVEASPHSAASVFVFIAVAAAGLRAPLARAAAVAVVGVLAVAIADLLYNGSALGLLAYALGFSATLLAAANARQRTLRAEQAELLVAQTQRSHEEQLRAARLEESTRIAREIHDVLAHTLAGLAIQLEATGALVEQGAEREVVLSRVQRAHELAREGLHETRRAVGALRGEPASAPERIAALVEDYRSTPAAAELTIDGDRARLAGPTGEAVVRVTQEALTNVRKHAPGAAVVVTVHAGETPGDEVVLVIDDRPARADAGPLQAAGAHADRPQATARNAGLAATGGGYGLNGMRERAEVLGGTLSAGPAEPGWRVELRLPAPALPRVTSGAEVRGTSGAEARGTSGAEARGASGAEAGR